MGNLSSHSRGDQQAKASGAVKGGNKSAKMCKIVNDNEARSYRLHNCLSAKMNSTVDMESGIGLSASSSIVENGDEYDAPWDCRDKVVEVMHRSIYGTATGKLSDELPRPLSVNNSELVLQNLNTSDEIYDEPWEQRLAELKPALTGQTVKSSMRKEIQAHSKLSTESTQEPKLPKGWNASNVGLLSRSGDDQACTLGTTVSFKVPVPMVRKSILAKKIAAEEQRRALSNVYTSDNSLPVRKITAEGKSCQFSVQTELNQMGSTESERKEKPLFPTSLSFRSSTPNNKDSSTNLQDHLWYHGMILRPEAEARMRNMPEGAFLVRQSEHSGGSTEYVLTLSTSSGVMHMKIQRDHNGRWVIGSHSIPFKSVQAMIDYYSDKKLPIKGAQHVCLKIPVENYTASRSRLFMGVREVKSCAQLVRIILAVRVQLACLHSSR
ncbi:SH2 domain-containing adapter protein F [Trichinella zimbabwensis]|uniref:SH2 domain-containing adapter protein F n=1 Tax=Trichinella zimbabwensis TaxID=268475 RepID=A0A0V1HL51_9BILA|nr:SH2 domain-containing adapter protein F [Trichinella zimbabwensis]